MKPVKYADLESLCNGHRHIKKAHWASLLGVSASRFSKLKSLSAKPTDDEEQLIAELIGQGRAYVRRLYGKERAA